MDVLRAIESAWNEGGKTWDAARLTSNYTADAFFFGGRTDHAMGADAILAYFVSYRGIIESCTMDLVDQHVVQIAPGCILAQGFVNFSFVLNGRGSTSSRLRTTLTFVETSTGWRIRQHHFSPIPQEPPLG